MPYRLEDWSAFLSIDAELQSTLRRHIGLVEDRIDTLLGELYARIAQHPPAARLFASPQSLAHARAAQRRHWLEHVFVGRFDAQYQRAAIAVGQAHYRHGVDLLLFSGGYAWMLNALTGVAISALANDPAELQSYLAALQRAVFLDMGITSSVYYHALTGELEYMTNELNFALARAGEFRDNETGRHLTRMSQMCRALALAAGAEPRWAQRLLVASPLHDVGKIGIPDRVLLKPGRLSEDELEVMRRHPEIGGSIIPDAPSEVIRMARQVSLTHHERWDGKGYPAGLCGEQIPLEGRIAAICDVYDALLSERPYKPGWPRRQALDYLQRHSGSHFDPQLVACFFRILPQIDAIQRQFAEPAEGETAASDPARATQ